MLLMAFVRMEDEMYSMREDIEKIRKTSLESISAIYDWKNIINYYDTTFEKMIY